MSYRNYKVKLDTARSKTNKDMSFYISDIQADQFTLTITEKGQVFDVEGFVIALIGVSPKNVVSTQYIDNIDSNVCTIKLERQMMNEVGQWTCRAVLFNDECTLVLDSFTYTVNQDELSKVGEAIQEDDRFPILNQLLSDNKLIQQAEQSRVISENERIQDEQQRIANEETRQSKEINRQQSEVSRNQSEQQRVEAEDIRIENEEQRKLNEVARQETYEQIQHDEQQRQQNETERIGNHNIITKDVERIKQEAEAHKAAEEQRVANEQQRISQETERKTAEQTRVSNETTRQANETERQSQEQIRGEQEQGRQENEAVRESNEASRQSNYNTLFDEMNTSKDNFDGYTEQAKVNEETRKANEVLRQQQEQTRADNEVERIANEDVRKAQEQVRINNDVQRQTTMSNKISELDAAKNSMTNTVSNKVNDIETRFNELTSKQQQDAEVIDARDGETSLKARLDRDIEKAKQVYVNIEGSNISTDSSSGYAKDVEILGNTIQDASNLADIRSVGDKVEGQELYEIPVLSVGKNLFDVSKVVELHSDIQLKEGAITLDSKVRDITSITKFKPNIEYTLTYNRKVMSGNGAIGFAVYYTDGSSEYLIGHTPLGFLNFTFGKNKTVSRFVLTYSNICTCELSNIQLEEGTQPTPYEPYQEDKLTILSPVQLEKVGDVRDRILCKDGIWGVEKNIVTKQVHEFSRIIKGNTNSEAQTISYHMLDFNAKNTGSISDLITNAQNVTTKYVDGTECVIRFDASFDTVDKVRHWCKSNGIFVKYAYKTPQFIPLPHDQQVKLRTFANKTNISFLTEIEGTIKAQVPKSLGATVNTHTEQINNLNKELGRVKKLEESTVSTVTTESDFTTVEATSNGYFEDVKLEGKTLVNLSNLPSGDITITKEPNNCKIIPLIPLTSSDVVYLAFNCKSVTSDYQIGMIYRIIYTDSTPIDYVPFSNSTTAGYKQLKVTPKSNIKEIDLMMHTSNNADAESVISDVMLMYEKDYSTQNPPSYFEGLKSVGQSATTSEDGVDEIVVSSVKGDGNLFDGELQRGYWYNGEIKPSDNSVANVNNIHILQNTQYYISVENYSDVVYVAELDESLNEIKNFTINNGSGFITSTTGTYLRMCTSNAVNVPLTTKIQIVRSTTPKPYTPYQSDKKRLLYYNEETQAWEKPILREWDSIEKHADGKYYYHQRSGEVVLNGSEDWKYTNSQNGENTLFFHITINTSKKHSSIICDTMKVSSTDLWLPSVDFESVFITDNYFLQFRINKSKLSTQDVQGFKQWLQANNVTVVYQLAQEKVYECTNIDLITYANETNYVVESGAIVPKTTLKVMSNISNVVRELQQKVSTLESYIQRVMIDALNNALNE